jgi:hypothetical protein
MRTADILRGVKAGTLDGLRGPVEISDRTVYDKLRKVRQRLLMGQSFPLLVSASNDPKVTSALREKQKSGFRGEAIVYVAGQCLRAISAALVLLAAVETSSGSQRAP